MGQKLSSEALRLCFVNEALGRTHTHYTLEPDPELPLGDSPAPRERLVFAFSTADVVVFGARLSFLVELLRDQKLTAVWPLAERYSNLEPSQPFVSSITIRTLKSDASDSE